MNVTKANTDAANHSSSFVHADIIHGVLQRLPVKSLYRFRCLSKVWCNEIDTVPFACANIDASTPVADQECEILYKKCSTVLKLLAYNGNSNLMKKSKYPKLEFSNQHSKLDYHLDHVAYSGLLCFTSNVGKAFLCNPLRGEVLELPPRDQQYGSGYSDWISMGFDSTNGAFKIVRIYRKCSAGQDDDKIFFSEVYTLGTKSGRRISSVPSCYCKVRWEKRVHAYGDVHWQCYRDEKEQLGILSFDFKKEEFKCIIPNLGFGYKDCELISLKGNLSIFKFSSETIEIWELEDYYDHKKDWVIKFTMNVRTVWVRDESQHNRSVERDIDKYINTWEGPMELKSVTVCNNGLFIEIIIPFPEYNKSQYASLFLDLKTKCLWYVQNLQNNRFRYSTTFRYPGSILSFKHLGYGNCKSVLGIYHRYRILKTVSWFYPSPFVRYDV